MINFHKKRFKNKREKILKQKNNNDNKTLKLLEIFNLYLKRWGFFVTKIKNESNNYYVKINDKKHEINELPKILVDNFLLIITLK